MHPRPYIIVYIELHTQATLYMHVLRIDPFTYDTLMLCRGVWTAVDPQLTRTFAVRSHALSWSSNLQNGTSQGNNGWSYKPRKQWAPGAGWMSPSMPDRMDAAGGRSRSRGRGECNEQTAQRSATVATVHHDNCTHRSIGNSTCMCQSVNRTVKRERNGVLQLQKRQPVQCSFMLYLYSTVQWWCYI